MAALAQLAQAEQSGAGVEEAQAVLAVAQEQQKETKKGKSDGGARGGARGGALFWRMEGRRTFPRCLFGSCHARPPAVSPAPSPARPPRPNLTQNTL